MAKLSNGYQGTTLYVEKLQSMSFTPGRGYEMTDIDGAVIHLSDDVVAHIISVTTHVFERQGVISINELLQRLCNCPPHPLSTKKRT